MQFEANKDIADKYLEEHDNVCTMCGGELEVALVDDVYHPVCMRCSRIMYGVSRDMFDYCDNYTKTYFAYQNEYVRQSTRQDFCLFLNRYLFHISKQ